MPASKYTEAQRAEAIELYRTDGPTAVTEQLGIPKQTVQDWARKAGVRTVRTSATREATEARAVDLKARRQELAELLLDDAHRLRKQLWEPTMAFSFGGKDNTYEEAQIPEPTFGDKKNIMSSVSTAMNTVVNMTKLDQDNGVGEVVSMLDKLIGNLGVPDE